MKYGMLLLAVMAISFAGCNVGVEVSAPMPQPTQSVEVAADATHVSLKVPKMECPFACWPKVKETLEAQPGVTNVVLAPQKDENEIDNPQVEIEIAEGFDAAKAIEAVGAAGFDGASVVASK